MTDNSCISCKHYEHFASMQFCNLGLGLFERAGKYCSSHEPAPSFITTYSTTVPESNTVYLNINYRGNK